MKLSEMRKGIKVQVGGSNRIGVLSGIETVYYNGRIVDVAIIDFDGVKSRYNQDYHHLIKEV